MTSDEDKHSENERKHVREKVNGRFFTPDDTGNAPVQAAVRNVSSVSSAEISWTCHAWSQYYEPWQSLALGISSSQVLHWYMLGFLFFSPRISQWLPPPRKLCSQPCLIVVWSVSRITQKYRTDLNETCMQDGSRHRIDCICFWCGSV